MNIDIKTAAYMLGTSEEMLLRWVKQGVIQPSTAEEGPLFDEKTLRDWAAKRRMPVRRADGVSEPPPPAAVDHASLQAAMLRGGVHFDVSASDVRGTLKAAVARLNLSIPVDKEDLLERLMAREALASTGIGGGIAIPHPRKPLATLPEGGIIASCFPDAPVDFMAVDGKPVFVFFLMLSPTTKRHLELLSRLSFCIGNPAVSSILPSLKDEKSLLKAVARVEKEIRADGA